MSTTVWFARHGTLAASAEDRVTQSEAGYFASELEDILRVPVKEALLQLVAQMTTDKRGLSALLLQRQLGLSRYETAWMILHIYTSSGGP